MKTRVSVKHFATYCLWKPLFDSDLSQTPLNLIFYTILATVKLLTLLQPIVRAIKSQKRDKICLTR